MAHFSLLDPLVHRDPYPYYAELRRDAPVAELDPGGILGISRYADVQALLKAPELCSSRGMRAMIEQPWLDYHPLSHSMLVMDPPEHGRVRALVSRAFGSRVVPRIEPIARRVCADFAARIAGGAELDVCKTIAVDLPSAVMTELLGLDPGLAPRLREWSDAIVAVSPGTPPEFHENIRRSIADLTNYARQAIEARRRAPKDDLLSDLLGAEIDGERLTQEQLEGFLFLLLLAGFETTAHTLSNALRVLAERPELIARLRHEPASIPAFAEEVLRYDTPAQGLMRLAVEPFEIAGTRIPAGRLVLLLVASANRDETRFAHPDLFDMDRTDGGSLTFGHGVHFCLGAALARAEMHITLEELVPRLGRVQLLEEPTWNVGITVRGALECKIAFVPV